MFRLTCRSAKSIIKSNSKRIYFLRGTTLLQKRGSLKQKIVVTKEPVPVNYTPSEKRESKTFYFHLYTVCI